MQTARRAIVGGGNAPFPTPPNPTTSGIVKVLPLITQYKQSDTQAPEKPPFKSQIQKPKPKTKSATDEIFFIK